MSFIQTGRMHRFETSPHAWNEHAGLRGLRGGGLLDPWIKIGKENLPRQGHASVVRDRRHCRRHLQCKHTSWCICCGVVACGGVKTGDADVVALRRLGDLSAMLPVSGRLSRVAAGAAVLSSAAGSSIRARVLDALSRSRPSVLSPPSEAPRILMARLSSASPGDCGAGGQPCSADSHAAPLVPSAAVRLCRRAVRLQQSGADWRCLLVVILIFSEVSGMVSVPSPSSG